MHTATHCADCVKAAEKHADNPQLKKMAKAFPKFRVVACDRCKKAARDYGDDDDSSSTTDDSSTPAPIGPPPAAPAASSGAADLLGVVNALTPLATAVASGVNAAHAQHLPPPAPPPAAPPPPRPAVIAPPPPPKSNALKYLEYALIAGVVMLLVAAVVMRSKGDEAEES